MIATAPGMRIFVFNQHTDMQKSFNGLSGLVTQNFQVELLSGHLFLFFNRVVTASNCCTGTTVGWRSGTNDWRLGPSSCYPAIMIQGRSIRPTFRCYWQALI